MKRNTQATQAIADDRFAGVRKEVRKLLRMKKRDFRNQQLQELQDLYWAEETRSVNVEKKGYKPRLGTSNDQQGLPLTGKEAISNRWAEYFENLLYP